MARVLAEEDVAKAGAGSCLLLYAARFMEVSRSWRRSAHGWRSPWSKETYAGYEATTAEGRRIGDHEATFIVRRTQNNSAAPPERVIWN